MVDIHGKFCFPKSKDQVSFFDLSLFCVCHCCCATHFPLIRIINKFDLIMFENHL